MYLKIKKYSPPITSRIFLFWGLGLCFFSCEQDKDADSVRPASYPVKFGFNIVEDPGYERILDIYQPHEIRLSITTGDGEVVKENVRLNLSPNGKDFISEQIELVEGVHELNSFQVLSETSEVIYATPLKGSFKEYLVADPLPYTFSIMGSADKFIFPQVTSVLPEDNPSDFGYVSFDFLVNEGTEIPIRILSDVDGSLIETQVTISAYALIDSSLASSHQVSYDGLDNNSFYIPDSFLYGIDNYIGFYSIEIGHEDYHSLKHYYRDLDLFMSSENDGIDFYLSPNVETEEVVWEDFRLPFFDLEGYSSNPTPLPEDYLQDVKIYHSTSPCSSFIRVDFGGSSASDLYTSRSNVIFTVLYILEGAIQHVEYSTISTTNYLLNEAKLFNELQAEAGNFCESSEDIEYDQVAISISMIPFLEVGEYNIVPSKLNTPNAGLIYYPITNEWEYYFEFQEGLGWKWPEDI